MAKPDSEILINCGCGETFAGYDNVNGNSQIIKAIEEAQQHSLVANHILHIQGKISPAE